VLAVCDGLVWAELGAAMPGSGGSYRYLREIYGPQKLGRAVSFLFIWQLSFSAPLSIASGSIGLAGYASYYWPSLERGYVERNWSAQLPLLGPLRFHWIVSGATLLSVGVVALAVFFLYRKITSIGWLSKALWLGVMITIGWIIFAGLTHFDRSRAFTFPAGAFTLSRNFFLGLGSAMLIATYDYWGYYNVCFLGDEVKDPEKTIPRALLLSILLTACLYIVMNICILGVIPWQEIVHPSHFQSGFYVVSLFMQRIYGEWAGKVVTALIVWTAFGSVFSLLLGYSRVPYAAARDGNYFSYLAAVHPKHHIPHRSLVALGLVGAAFCFFSLAQVITMLVITRILLQFFLQQAGVMLLRVQRPELERPFKIPLYPLPPLAAIAGFLFILLNRTHALEGLAVAVLIGVSGTIIYLIRARRLGQWPFLRIADGK